ncbi:hypothetical protein CCP4SC76_5870001 [Gammaproteobacteria bacterium]
MRPFRAQDHIFARGVAPGYLMMPLRGGRSSPDETMTRAFSLVFNRAHKVSEVHSNSGSCLRPYPNS